MSDDSAGLQDTPLSYPEFERVEMRVGRIVRAERFPEARRPAYRLWVDLGELGIRTSSAQITDLYEPDDLVGRQVVAVVNFPPKRIAGFASEVLVLGAPAASGEIVLLTTEQDVPPGGRIY